jgi:hypothetical protein
MRGAYPAFGALQHRPHTTHATVARADTLGTWLLMT